MTSSASSKSGRGFASDNYAGVHPDILAAIADVNTGHAPAYGDDPVTAEFQSHVTDLFGESAVGFPVFNGTGANVIALQAVTQRWEAVICADTAHIHVDEGGAPEKMAGLKLWTVSTPDGKLTPELIRAQMFDVGVVHRAQPAVVSITQTTELGTLYTLEEITAITATAHELGLKVHMDGARLSNAVEALSRDYGRTVTFYEMTTGAGVDILSFGGTKIGALGAEAVITLTDNPEIRDAVPFLRKTSMQLASKMRFISAQLNALLKNDAALARANARHANAMAERLDAGIRMIAARTDRVLVPNRTAANAVFPIIPDWVARDIYQTFRFYTWNPDTGMVRWMCSWDTTDVDVTRLLILLEEALTI